jgi:hypothetical protein
MGHLRTDNVEVRIASPTDLDRAGAHCSGRAFETA